jgi:hypothetical protein
MPSELTSLDATVRIVGSKEKLRRTTAKQSSAGVNAMTRTAVPVKFFFDMVSNWVLQRNLPRRHRGSQSSLGIRLNRSNVRADRILTTRAD